MHIAYCFKSRPPTSTISHAWFPFPYAAREAIVCNQSDVHIGSTGASGKQLDGILSQLGGGDEYGWTRGGGGETGRLGAWQVLGPSA